MGKKKRRTGPIPTGQMTSLFLFVFLETGFFCVTTQVLTISLPSRHTDLKVGLLRVQLTMRLSWVSFVPAQGWCAARSFITLQLYQALPSEVLCRGPRPMSIQDNTLVRTLG